MFLGKPVIIDPTTPPLERDAEGNIVLPGGYYANFCEVCGEHYGKHENGECPEKRQGE